MMEDAAILTSRAETRPTATTQAGFFAACFALSGLFFVLYPAIRPFSSEVGLEGAQAFASSRWIVAHSLGILGFILLGLGVLGVYLRMSDSPLAGRMVGALTLVWVGVGLTIPYYGAEVFGLHAVGQRTLSENNPGMLKPLAHGIRWEAGIYFILIGLVLLAIGSILVGRAVWHSGRFNRWSGVPLAVGLVLYIPQFTGPQSVRIAHGLLMLAGCAWLSWELTKSHAPQAAEAGR